MTREIKFRVFSKECGMEYIDLYWFEEHCVRYSGDLSYYQMMQFTGLYDSTAWGELSESERKSWVTEGNMPSEWKGKPIYEGDIVVHQEEIQGVYWNYDGHFCACSDKNPSGYGTSDAWATYAKVIGNIHQNPDLLR